MDPIVISAIIQGTIAAWMPVLLASVKNPASKAKMKKQAPTFRTIGAEFIALADAIDAVSLKKRK